MGQGKIASAPIDESIGLLSKLNESALNDIRSRHPEFSSILETGVIGGEKELSKSELAIRIEVVKVTLEETLKQTKEKYLPCFRSKLRKLQKIELWSQIIIVISSSTVFGLLTQDLEKSGLLYTAYLAAALSLVGAILTIIIKQNSGEWSMNNHNVANLYNSLVTNRIKAEEILRELNIVSNFIESNASEILGLLEKSNNVNREIRLIIDNSTIE